MAPFSMAPGSSMPNSSPGAAIGNGSKVVVAFDN
jgi:hypothetical protein